MCNMCKVCNMFKVNIKDARKTPGVILVLYWWLWTCFTHCPSVFIVEFEQTNAGCDITILYDDVLSRFVINVAFVKKLSCKEIPVIFQDWFQDCFRYLNWRVKIDLLQYFSSNVKNYKLKIEKTNNLNFKQSNQKFVLSL